MTPTLSQLPCWNARCRPSAPIAYPLSTKSTSSFGPVVVTSQSLRTPLSPRSTSQPSGSRCAEYTVPEPGRLTADPPIGPSWSPRIRSAPPARAAELSAARGGTREVGAVDGAGRAGPPPQAASPAAAASAAAAVRIRSPPTMLLPEHTHYPDRPTTV